MWDYLLELDKSLFLYINSQWTAIWADQFFPAITDLHKNGLFRACFFLLLVVFLYWKKGIRQGVVIFVFSLLAVAASDGLGNWAFKKTVQRPRPPETQGLNAIVRSPYGGYSFVSNHAANTFCVASFYGSIFPAAALPLYAVATLVAYSRVYNGVHFPSDVMAGALLGILISFVFFSICRRVLDRMKNKSGAG